MFKRKDYEIIGNVRIPDEEEFFKVCTMRLNGTLEWIKKHSEIRPIPGNEVPKGIENSLSVNHVESNTLTVAHVEGEIVDELIIVLNKDTLVKLKEEFITVKNWSIINKDLVIRHCYDYDTLIHYKDIKDGFVTRNALDNLIRRYEENVGKEFNSDNEKFDDINLELKELFSRAFSHSSYGPIVNDNIEISRDITRTAELYLKLLGIRGN